MNKAIHQLREQFLQDLSQATNSSSIEALRVKYLGKKGPVQQLMVSLKEVTPEERPNFGKEVNDLKQEITDRLQDAFQTSLEQEETNRLADEVLDITEPGNRRFLGRAHIISQEMDIMIDLFREMGFSVQYGPDIDSEYYNFDALNMPSDHPARDMQDTFYIAPHTLLRTHTSNIQARLMEKDKPPIRAIAPGRAYRNEAISARSHVFFHQLDGFYVDEGVSFSDLFYTLKTFFQNYFKQELPVRFRPSFFPFVEPGLEIDIACLSCKGEGCYLCKQAGWLEVAGAGMIHPEVLKNGNIDPERYTGFAWGMGIERLVMLKYGIRDIRLFTENNLKFLRQFQSA